MSTAKSTSSSIDQGVDRKALAIIKSRFLQVNNARLARTKSALIARQQIFLDILPMLFHVNHPMLPGYVSHQTPCGVAHYVPSKQHIQKTQRLARSFTYRRQPGRQEQIHGIFLMGSCGTVAQSESSDLDIWICHHSNLSTDNKLLLKQKTDAITRWAETIGLEAHFFLMDADKFRHGERENLSSEDCGSSQHYLLLDEFYRTGLFIAGRIPIWWLVPPEEDPHYDYYANTLRDKRFVRTDDTLDFGGIAEIPAGEFVGAGIWQLYKGIDSPYKSALKILLSEVYAQQYPNIEPLSCSFKRAIYQDQLDIDELDPYVMVLRKLEAYLLRRNELERLELIRRCFYFKVGKAITRPQGNPAKSWQRQLIEKLVREWQWTNTHLKNLDARHKWRVTRVIAEQKDVVRELTNSYRFLLEFARRSQATALINSQEMTVLGRKLYAAFEKKAGKIAWINPGISKNLAEESLTFYQFKTANNANLGWAVTAESLNSQDPTLPKTPLKQADDIISVLAWCHFNGIMDKATRIGIVNGEHTISDYELQCIIRSLGNQLPTANQYIIDSDASHERFSRAMHPTQLQLFINIGTDPLANMRSQGIERLSDRTDSLAYSGFGDNLVLNIEQVLVNSWGELNTRRYEGEHALVRCLRDYLQMLPPGGQHALPQLNIHCFCPTRATAISHRLEQLFRDIAACYYSGTRPASSRYVFEIQREFFVIQFTDQRPHIEHCESYGHLLTHLSQPQIDYSPLVLDRYCLTNSPLQIISEFSQADCLQIFYQCTGDYADIYIADELGSISYLQVDAIDNHSFLTPLDQFLQSTLFRQHSEVIDFMGDHQNLTGQSGIDLQYYQLQQRHNSYQALRRDPIADHGSVNFFNVQALGSRSNNEQLLFTIYCDQQEFTELELGSELYNAVAKFILQHRQSKQRYACHITDLDLSRCIDVAQGEIIQTCHYIKHKIKLEKALNKALLTV
mgnify:CR=1 FL=1